MTLRPRTAIAGDYQFTLRGPLAVAAGDRAGVPQIALSRVNAGTRFVVLPTRLEGEPIAWDVQGLQAVHRPELAVGAGRGGLSSGGAVFSGGGAAHRDFPGGARVRLADIRLAWQLDGACHGVATFAVEPGQDDGLPPVVAGRFPPGANGGGGRTDTADPGGGASLDVALGRRSGRPTRGSRLRRRRRRVFQRGNGRCSVGGAPSGAGIEPLGAAMLFSSTARWRFRVPMLGQLPVEQDAMDRGRTGLR